MLSFYCSRKREDCSVKDLLMQHKTHEPRLSRSSLGHKESSHLAGNLKLYNVDPGRCVLGPTDSRAGYHVEPAEIHSAPEFFATEEEKEFANSLSHRSNF